MYRQKGLKKTIQNKKKPQFGMKDRIAKVKEDNSLSTRFLNWQSRDLN